MARGWSGEVVVRNRYKEVLALPRISAAEGWFAEGPWVDVLQPLPRDFLLHWARLERLTDRYRAVALGRRQMLNSSWMGRDRVVGGRGSAHPSGWCSGIAAIATLATAGRPVVMPPALVRASSRPLAGGAWLPRARRGTGERHDQRR
jgi:hypothetical protein